MRIPPPKELINLHELIETIKYEHALKKNDIRLEYTVLSNANKTRFIAIAPHINIVGFGKSEDEAVKDFDKAVKCFIHFHEKNKNLHAKLLTLGWKIVDNYETIAPKHFSVPTELQTKNKDQE